MKSDFHFPGIDKQSKSKVASLNKDDALIQRCYALVPKDETSPKLSLIFRNGNRCTIPYAYIIRSVYDVKGMLSLFTTDIEIQITGRGLDKIDNWLAVNQLKWIKQHVVAIDPQTDKVFITNIEIKDRK
ncbi:MAG: hypothetical protein AAF741_06155 [Bacteroidota bacterium]